MRLLQTCCRDIPSFLHRFPQWMSTSLLGLFHAKDFGCFPRDISWRSLINAKDSGCFPRDIFWRSLINAKDSGCFRRDILWQVTVIVLCWLMRWICRLARVIFLPLSAILVCLIRRLSNTKDISCFPRDIFWRSLINAKDSGCFPRDIFWRSLINAKDSGSFRRDWCWLWAFLLLLLLLWVFLDFEYWLGLVLEANCEDWFSLGGGHDAEDCEKNSSHGIF